MIKPGILVILIAVCALLGAGLFLIQGDRPVAQTKVAQGSKLLLDYNTDGVTAIDIKRDPVSIELRKKDKDWILASQKDRAAKKDRVDKLLEDVKSATTVGDRSGKPESFKLDPKQRTELSLTRESGKTTLLLGESVENTNSFVRKDESSPILEVDKDLGADVGLKTEKEVTTLDPAWFYDLKLIAATADDIIDVAIKKGGETYRVQRVIPGKGPMQPKVEPGKDDPKPVWWLTEPEGGPANDSTCSSICSTAANLNAKSYADDVADKDSGLDQPTARVVIRMKDGTVYDFTFGKVESDDVIASVAGRPDKFKIYKYAYDTLTKTDDLKKKDEDKKDAAAKPAPKAAPKVAPKPTPMAAKPTPKPAPLAPVTKTAVAPPPPAAPAAKLEAPAKQPVIPPSVTNPAPAKVEEKKN